MRAAFLAILFAAASAAAQLAPLSNYWQRFDRGLTLGTNAYTNAAGTLRWNAVSLLPEFSDGADWTAIGTGTGSGGTLRFATTNAGSAETANTNAGAILLRAGTGIAFAHSVDPATSSSTVRVDASFVNPTNLVLPGDLTVLGDTALRDTVVTGTLTVVGTHYSISNVYSSTNVTLGVTTTYVAEVRYATQETFVTEIRYTNVVTTNQVDTYVNAGGNFTMGAGSAFDATGAASVAVGPDNFTIGGTSFAAAVSAKVSSKAESSAVAPLYLGSWTCAEVVVTSANSTVYLSTTNKAWRVRVVPPGTITNWAVTGVSTASLDWCGVVLEPGAATDFSWKGLRTNVPLPSAYSTNVYFPWRGPGSGYWTVD